MPEPERRQDRSRILQILVDHEVRFVVIGGVAAIVHGSPFPTEDVDVTPEQSMANLERLSTALSEMEARVRTDAVPGGLPFSHDAESLRAASVWNLVTAFGDLDISFVPSGTEGYADLVADAGPIEAYGVVVNIASLADVIRSKQAANRPKDQRVLPVLREILASRYQRD